MRNGEKKMKCNGQYGGNCSEDGADAQQGELSVYKIILYMFLYIAFHVSYVRIMTFVF